MLTGDSIYDDKELISKINDSIFNCYQHENMITIFEDDKYTIKGYIKNNFCYYVIMNDIERHFIICDLPLYIDGDNIKKLKHSFIYGGDITSSRIEMKIKTSIFSMKLIQNDYFISFDDMKWNKINERIDERHKNGLSFIDFYKITNNLFYFKMMVDFLVDFSGMYKLSLEKYISFSNDFSNTILDKQENIFLRFNFLKNICKKYKHDSGKNSFEYNDMDNYVWLDNDVLILESQNIFLYFYSDKSSNLVVNFSIKDYMQNTTEEDEENEEEFKSYYQKDINIMIEKIKNNNFDIIEECSLLVKDNNIVYSSETMFNIIEMNLTYSIKAIEEKYNEELTHPYNLSTPDYFIKFFNKKYKYNKFTTLSHIFLTLGNGIDWKNGYFSYDEMYYIKNLPSIDFIEQKEYFLYGKFNDSTYNIIEYLNEEWFNCLEEFYSFCIDNKEKLKTFPTENIDDILKSMKEFINNNERKQK